MDKEARIEKKRREAAALRDVPPERTLQMGFELTRAARALAKAAGEMDAA